MKTNDKFNVKGEQLITIFDVVSYKAKRIDATLNRLIKKGPLGPKLYRYLTNELKKSCHYEQAVVNNLVVLAGRAVIAQRLGNTNTYSLNITHGALGTSTTSPTASDTTLGAEVNRVETASNDVSDASNGIVVVSFFWSKASFTDSNVNEFGTFIDGSASVDTGELFSHVLFSTTIDKTAQKTITVDATYTIT